MPGVVRHWIVVAVALYVTAWLLPGVTVTSWGALAVGSLVLGLINALVRPLMVLLTLPLTVLTLGLFYLVVNGAAFMLGARLVDGFEVASFGWAMGGALLVSFVSGLIGGRD